MMSTQKAVVKVAVVVGVVAVFIMLVMQQRLNTVSTIQVSGQGRVAIKADAAMLNLSVTTVGLANAEKAVTGVSAEAEKVMQALADAGVAEENRMYSGLIMTPAYISAPDLSGNQRIGSYGATRQITILVKGIDADPMMVDKVVATAVKAGAEQVNEVRYISTKLDEVRQQARLIAVKNAQEYAKELANNTPHMRLGKVTNTYENVISGPQQNYYGNVPTSSSPVGSISEGSPEVVMEVTLTYEVR